MAASQTALLLLMVSGQVKLTTVPPALLLPSQSELPPLGAEGGSEVQPDNVIVIDGLTLRVQ